MEKKVSVVIRGIPITWKRPADVKLAGGHRRRYTPREVRKWQQKIRWHVLAEMNARALEKAPPTPVELHMRFYRPDADRCDLDNLEKAVLDALSGIVYDDDRRVWQVVKAKFRCDTVEEAKLEMEIFWGEPYEHKE